MGTVNQDIADALVDHRLAVLRFEGATTRDIVNAWLEATENLVKEAERIKRRARNTDRALTRTERRRLQDIRRSLGVSMATLSAEMEARMTAALTEVATVEVAVVASTIEAALPQVDGAAALRIAQAPPADIARAVSDPIGGNVWTARLARDLADANAELQAVIANAIDEGRSIPRTANALEAVTDIRQTYKGRFTAIARTEVQRVANTAAADTYRRNRDVVGSVQYLATLDSRTCAVCAPLHNKVFPLEPDGSVPTLIPGTPYRAPPIHPNCRCFLAPISKTFRDLGLDIDDPLERDRADGRQAINMDFESWLRRQPRSTQVEVLGEKRARLWRGNRLKLEQFSDRGRLLNLGQLRARYPGRVPA